MWIFLADAFLSFVADPSNPERVIVRARMGEHIESFLPKAQVWMVSSAENGHKVGPDDYRYKAIVSRDVLKAALIARVDDIQIGTFRDRINDPIYYDACNRVRKHVHAIERGSPYRFLNNPENQ